VGRTILNLPSIRADRLVTSRRSTGPPLRGAVELVSLCAARFSQFPAPVSGRCNRSLDRGSSLRHTSMAQGERVR
jgi:hypothetical protein